MTLPIPHPNRLSAVLRGGLLAALVAAGGCAPDAVAPEIPSYDARAFYDTEQVFGASFSAESPAEKAGFKSGDVVLEWDGETIEDMRDLPRLVADTAAGDKTEIKVWRDGKAKSLSVTPGDAPTRPKLAAAEQPPKATVEQLGSTGVAVANLTDETRQRFDIPNDVSGVVIAQVDKASAAAESGLRVGDVVSSIALDPVEDAKQAANRFDTVTAGKQPVVLLKVLREGASQFIVLRVA